MNTKEIRRQNLAALLGKYKTLPEFEDAAKVSGNYASQIANGFRDMGHSFARDIEAGLGLPEGWMDVIHTESKLHLFYERISALDDEGLQMLDKALNFIEDTQNFKKLNPPPKPPASKPEKSA